MLPPPFHNAFVLTGPTGSGKTRLALDLAQRLDAEIISMDSMALYRLMDIGTAKPTTAERSIVPHHLVDVLDPWESASVAWWLARARACVTDIEGRGKQALFVGGTPLYLKALLCGLFEGPAADKSLRQRLTHEAETNGARSLYERLAGVDPASASRLNPNDLRRIIRALEVFELTGRSISSWQKQWHRPDGKEALHPPVENQDSPGPASCLWLDVPRSELYERINRRVESMFQNGLVEEVEVLRKLAKPLSRTAQQALGYKEVLEHLEGAMGLKEAIVRVQTRSRNLAKRQITWFRSLSGCLPATSELTQQLWQSKMRT